MHRLNGISEKECKTKTKKRDEKNKRGIRWNLMKMFSFHLIYFNWILLKTFELNDKMIF